MRRQAFGFAAMLVLVWIAEAVRLPHWLLDEPIEFHWMRVLLRSGIILAIWAIVHLTTRRLVERLHYLEEFVRVCSWCRKINVKDEWQSMEQYFDSTLNARTTHGVCPDCMQRLSPKTAASAAVPPPEPGHRCDRAN